MNHLPHNQRNIEFYHQHAAIQAALYNQTTFEQVHAAWIDLLEQLPDGARICDIGAGNGRDAAALLQRNFTVYAVEPAQAMRELGMHQAPGAVWVDDQLPELNQLMLTDAHPYDLILISGVWMHLNPEQQQHALHVLAELMSPDGYLVLLLREGEFSDARIGFSCSREQVSALAREAGLTTVQYTATPDTLGRSDVRWGTLVLSLM